MDQVIAMKDILSGCLRKHIITPYPYLSEEKVREGGRERDKGKDKRNV